MTDLSNWTGREPVRKKTLEGHFVRLEPLQLEKHGRGLYEAITLNDADARFRYLPEITPPDYEAFIPWLENAQRSEDPLYFAVIDKATGKVAGRQTFLRTDAKNGVTEIGHILWSAMIARKPATTEAFYLFANYVFEELKYRRFEWKCNDANQPSKRAAIRYGMKAEGVHRQALVTKGENRDTAWFSMIDQEWPLCKAAFEAWLSPDNFDDAGQQIKKLEEIRQRLA
ncbi:MAG: GNAT family N-acetyltransferase [Hyphomicrobiales bacterium]|nr:GNAT family N-acetyltransferase [Hyphomicrobiales bacterium]